MGQREYEQAAQIRPSTDQITQATKLWNKLVRTVCVGVVVLGTGFILLYISAGAPPLW